MKMEIFQLRHAALVAALALAMGAPLSFADEVPVDNSTAVIGLPGTGIGAGIVVGDGALTDPPAPVVGEDLVIDPPALPVEGDDVVLGDPVPVDGGEVVVDPVPVEGTDVAVDPLPVEGTDVAVDPLPVEGTDVAVDPVPIDRGGIVLDPVPVEGTDVVVQDLVPVEGNEAVIDDTPPEPVAMDDCGVICQNVAGELPPEAHYRGVDEVPAEVLQFSSNGEPPAPSVDLSAELNSAVGAIGAAEQLGAADVAGGDNTVLEPLATSAPGAVVANAANGDSVSVIRNGHLR